MSQNNFKFSPILFKISLSKNIKVATTIIQACTFLLFLHLYTEKSNITLRRFFVTSEKVAISSNNATERKKREKIANEEWDVVISDCTKEIDRNPSSRIFPMGGISRWKHSQPPKNFSHASFFGLGIDKWESM